MGLLLEGGEIGKLVQGKTFVDPTADLVKNDPWNGRELSDEEAMQMGFPVAPDPISSLRDSYRKAMFEVNPDQAAFTQNLMDRTGAPGWMLEEYPEARKLAENELKLKETPEPDWDKLAQRNPATAGFLGASMDFSFDDIDNLAAVEDGFGKLGYLWKRGKQGFYEDQLGGLGTRQMFGDDSSETEAQALELEKKISADFGDYGTFMNLAGGSAQVAGQMFSQAPVAATFASVAMAIAAASGVGTAPALGVAGSLGTFAGIGGAAAFGGVAGSLYKSFSLEGGSAFREFVRLTDENGNPIDRNAARAAAILVGLVNAGIEVAQIGELLKPFLKLGMTRKLASRALAKELLRNTTTRGALANVFKNYGKTLASEVTQEGLQEWGTVLGGGLAKFINDGSLNGIDWNEAGGRILETMGEAAKSFALLPVPGTAVSFASDYSRAVHAQQVKETFTAIADASKRSKTLARLPRAFEAFVERATRNREVDKVYVSPQAFDMAFAQGPADVARELGIEEEYTAAKASNGEIAIPISTFAARVAPSDAFASLQDDVRVGEDALTGREANELLEKMQAEQQVRMDQAREAIAREDAWGEELRQVHQEVRDMRKMADSKVTDEEAEADALVLSSGIHVAATRRGQTPLGTYRSLGFALNGEASFQGGALYAQGIAEAEEKLARDETTWGETVDRVLAGQFNPRDQVPVMTTPLVFSLVGAEVLPVEMDAAKIASTMGTHPGMGIEQMKQIPSAMADPIAIFESTSSGNAPHRGLVAMLETKDTNGATIISALHLDVREHGRWSVTRINKLASFYGKDNKAGIPNNQWFKDQAKEGRLLYVNKEKSLAWGRSAGHLVPPADGTPQATLSEKSIKTEADLVKLKGQRPGYYQGAPGSGSFRKVDAKAFLEQRDKNKRREFLTPYTEEEMKGWRHFLTDDGVGFALTPENDMVGVFNNSGRKGAGQEAIVAAIAEGAKTCDCVADFLAKYYNDFGFIVKDVMDWDDNLAPKGWDYESNGRPKVYFLEYPDGLSRDPVVVARRADLARAERSSGPAVGEEGDRFYDSGFHEEIDARARVQKPGLDLREERPGETYPDAGGILSQPGQVGSTQPLGETRGAFSMPAARGQVNFSEGKTVVSLFKGAADRSTFVHEVGHVLLKLLEEDASLEGADPDVVRDFAVIRDWLGVKDGEKITTEQHETFARGFEAYLMTGEAPTVGLRRAFRLFQDWLTQIYRTMRGLNVEVSPEVSEVFDRLLATEDQIQATRELDGFNDLLAQETGVLSEPETVFMRSLQEQAEAEAERRLRGKAMKDVEHDRKAEKETRRAELRGELTEKVGKEPVHSLRRILTLPRKKGGTRISFESAVEAMEDLVTRAGWSEGTEANQAAETQLEEMRTRREAIRRELREVKKALSGAEGEKAPKGRINYLKAKMHRLEGDIATINEQLKPLVAFERKERTGAGIPVLPKSWFVRDGGADIEVLAQEYGYTSGSEMLEDLMTAPELADDVRHRVEAAIEAEFPVTSREELEEEANRALHGKHRLEFLAVERMVLSRLAKREMRLEEAKARAEAARKAARKILGGKPWKEAGNWKRFLAAERRAQRAAERALLSGDFETALQHKDTQVLQHALCAEAMKIADSNASMLKTLKKYANRKRTDTFGLPASYLDQIDAILEDYEFRPVGLDEQKVRADIAEWAARQEAMGLPVDIPEEILKSSRRTVYTKLSYDRFQEVWQAVKNIETLGKLEGMLVSLEKRESLDSAVNRLVRSAEANVPLERSWHTSSNPNATLVQKLKDLNDSKDAQLVKAQTVLLLLDGVKGIDTPGAWTELLWVPFREAAQAKHELLVKSGQDLSALLKRHYGKGEWKKALKRKTYIESLGYSLTGEQILCTALNWGNEKNRQRLMDGKSWDANQVNEILSHLGKRDWDFVQGVWDHLQSFWPMISALDRELVGYAPVQEEAAPVVTPYGVYRGGYYPLGEDYGKRVADRRLDPDRTESLMKQAATYRSATRNGFRKARVQAAEYQLRLDLGVLYRHIDDVVHDLTHRKAVIDAKRILSDRDLRKAVLPRLGRPLLETLDKWVDDVGRPQKGAHDVASRWSRVVRRNVTMANLMFKTTVNLLQGLGIFSTAGVLKARTVNAVAMYYLRPWTWHRDWKKAFELSSFLGERAGVVDDNVREFLTNAYGDSEGPVKRAARTLFNLFDGLVTVPTWWEGYRIGLVKYGGDQEKAVGYADDLVRQTQGGVGTLDSSEFQRSTSEWKRAFGMFYSYFNMLFAQMFKARKEVHGVRDVPAYIGTVGLIWLVPAVLEEVIRGDLPDDDDRDDPSEWLKWLASSTLSYWAGTMPLVRDVVPFLTAKATGYGYQRMGSTPMASTVESLGRTLEKARKFAEDDAELKDLLEASTKFGAYVVPYPMQFHTAVWSFMDWMDGEDPEIVWQRLVWGRSRAKR